MQKINKMMMLSMSVSDMNKAKEFYINKLGLKSTIDYRMDDDNWWVTLTFPDGGVTITLSRAKKNLPSSVEGIKPGTMTLYFETKDINSSQKEFKDKGLEIGEITDNLFGPESKVKWFNIKDPDGNQIIIAQAHERTPNMPF